MMIVCTNHVQITIRQLNEHHRLAACPTYLTKVIALRTFGAGRVHNWAAGLGRCVLVEDVVDEPAPLALNRAGDGSGS